MAATLSLVSIFFGGAGNALVIQSDAPHGTSTTYIHEEMPWSFHLMAFGLPLPALIAMLVQVRRTIARQDELERRIQVDALAIAFVLLSIAMIGSDPAVTMGIQEGGD